MGEPVSRQRREMKIGRSQLHRWRDDYREEGATELRSIGRVDL